MLGNNVSIGQAAVICVFSMVVIFAVLLVISFAIDILSVFQRKGSRHPSGNSEKAQTQAANPDVLMIAAAIAAYLGKGIDEIVVREIRTTQNRESEWCRSARIDALHNNEER